MPFNLLLLPLIGGFFFLHRTYRLRFFLVRYDGHRLIFFSAFVGVLLLATSTIAVSLAIPRLPQAVVAWHQFVPFAHSGKSFLAMMLGFFAPLPLNVIWWRGQWVSFDWRKENSIRKAVRYFSNDIEVLLLRSMDNESTVLLTMGSGKVYVGYITELFNPDVDRKHIKILPTMSGYRKASDRTVVFTTAYATVRSVARQDGSGLDHLSESDFEIVLALNDLKSVSLFDSAAYEEFTSLSVTDHASQDDLLTSPEPIHSQSEMAGSSPLTLRSLTSRLSQRFRRRRPKQ